MSLLRNAIRSNFALRAVNPHNSLPLFLRESPKHFSTESEQPPAPESAPQEAAADSSIDPFLQTTGRGLVYGKLLGITKHTLKADIINLLAGCNLAPDDIKVNYNRAFTPLAMMVQFRSRNAFENAFRAISKKGRLYRLEKVDRSQWDLLMPYHGKTVLVEGIPRNAIPEDVERFLSGCEYDSSSLQLNIKPGFTEPSKVAVVRFNSRTEAMNAWITKNRGFCLNKQVSVRVLE